MGAYLKDDRCFYPDAQGLGPISDHVSELQNASQLVIRGAEGEHDWTIFVVAGRAAAVVADRRISISWTRKPGAPRLVLRRYQTSLHCLVMSRAAQHTTDASHGARGGPASMGIRLGNAGRCHCHHCRWQAGDAQSCSSLTTDVSAEPSLLGNGPEGQECAWPGDS